MSESGPSGEAPAAMLTPAWRAFLDQRPETGTVDLVLPDLVGVPRGKRLAVSAIEGVLRGEVGSAGSVYALDSTGANVDASGLVWENGDADRKVALDPGTFRPLPWLDGGAQVLGGLLDETGGPFFADPRSVLQHVISRLSDDFGLTPVVATEFEFYLLAPRSDRDGRPRPRRAGREEGVQVYSLDALDQEQAFFETLDDFCAKQDLPAKGAIAEYAPGQFEVNLGHRSNALEAADHGFLLKRTVKAAARAAGAQATFMAKPFADQAASGLHIHVSLLDRNGENVFAADEKTLLRALGGLQATMAEGMLLFAPNANSFRRLRPRSYAPLAATWGHDNRTVALRIPSGEGASRRIEHRVAGADANPYLVVAAVLAGLHHGLAHEIDPGPPVTGNAYEKTEPNLPIAWDRAIDRMAEAAILPGYLGQEFCSLYRICREAERDRYQEVIPSLDYAWYQQVI